MAKQAETPGIHIRIRGIEDGKHPLEIHTSAEVLELSTFKRDLSIDGFLTKDHERITIEGTAKAEAELECSRCTDTFTTQIKAPLFISLIPPNLAKDDEELDDEVHIYDQYISPTFDITQDVRDALGTAVPMKPLCRPNCKGLCPVCGKNRNEGECGCETPQVESAWTSSLKGLQEKLRREEGEE